MGIVPTAGCSPLRHGDIPVPTEMDVLQLLPASNTPNSTGYMQQEHSMKPALMKKAKYAVIFSPNGHSVVPEVTDYNKKVISEKRSIPL